MKWYKNIPGWFTIQQAHDFFYEVIEASEYTISSLGIQVRVLGLYSTRKFSKLRLLMVAKWTPQLKGFVLCISGLWDL